MSDKHQELFHYTSISALKGILETNSLWATEAMHLNDSSELQLMWDKIAPPIRNIYEKEVKKYRCRHPEHNERIKAVGGAASIAELDGPTMVNVLRSQVLGDGAAPAHVRFFVASFTTHSGSNEHDPYHIDHGMLSQWRSYGRDDGVAIIFDAKGIEELIQTESEVFQYWPSLFKDVFYVAKDEPLENHFPQLFQSIRSFVHEFINNPMEPNADGPTGSSLNQVIVEFGRVLPLLKHAGFHEERECRIVVGVESTLIREMQANTGGNEKTIHNRRGPCGSIPYVSLFEDYSQVLPIKRIIVAPSRKQDTNFQKARGLAKGRGIKVQKSDTPFAGSA